MAEKTMHHAVIGNDTFELVDQSARADVSELKNAFNSVASYVEPVNIFDKATANRGHFISYADGEIIVRDQANMTYAIIPVKPNTTYTCSRVNYNVFLLDADGQYDSALNPQALEIYPFTFTTTATTAKVALSWKWERISEAEYMVVEGSTLPQSYIPYVAPYWKINESVRIEEVYHVGADKEYTSIMDCLKALANNTNPKTIYIDAGQYDIFEEIGGSTFCQSIEAGTNWREVSVFVPDNTSVIGLGLVELLFHPTISQIGSVAANLISPINVSYNANFENISIDSYNCRYGIHCDGDGVGIKQTYKNVRIKHRLLDGGMRNGFGAGTYNKNTFVFDDCVFDAWLPLSYHNNGTHQVDGTQIVFNNCVFKSTYPDNNPAIRFGNVNPNQVRIDVRLNGCYLNSNIRIINEAEGVERPNAFAIEALNSSQIVLDSHVATNIYTPIEYTI